MRYTTHDLKTSKGWRNCKQCPKGRNPPNEGARARAYVVVENPQQNPNVVTGTFLLKDHYACILFDSGAEKSFVSSAFTPFIDIAPTALNTSYEVELADGKVTNSLTHGGLLRWRVAQEASCFILSSELLTSGLNSMSEDIQCAGFDTRPPMLDRTDFESWHNNVYSLYMSRKDNGENIIRSPLMKTILMGTAQMVLLENCGCSSTKSPEQSYGSRTAELLVQVVSGRYNAKQIKEENHFRETMQEEMFVSWECRRSLNDSTDEASGSKPRSNTKKNRICLLKK
ncbi:hypothetical protein Tco_0024472 [Tanacetum coccineum]